MNFLGSSFAESTFLIGADLKSLKKDDMCFLIVSKIFIFSSYLIILLYILRNLSQNRHKKSPGSPRLLWE
jgi:hypothetical protein